MGPENVGEGVGAGDRRKGGAIEHASLHREGTLSVAWMVSAADCSPITGGVGHTAGVEPSARTGVEAEVTKISLNILTHLR